MNDERERGATSPKPPGRWRRRAIVVAPFAVAAIVAILLSTGGHLVGQGIERLDDGVGRAADPTDPPPADPPPPRDAGVDASWRFAPDGAIIAPPADTDYACRQPRLVIPKSEGCERGEGYPTCRWQVPDDEASAGLYRVWRNTTPEHRWGRASLVSLVLGVAAEYQRRWPGEQISIGDLDAPGPRHQTHDQGHDVDLYLEEAMIARNEGRGRYPDNYERRSRRTVELLRARVMDLARMIAVCARGEIRIYYNDPLIIRPFREWFDARGLSSSVGPPMRPHNPLHRFHFHLTIADHLEPLPLEEE